MAATIQGLTTAEYQALLVGLPKYCASTIFPYAGQSYTAPQVVTFIAAILNAKVAVAPAKGTWLAAVHAAEQTEIENAKIVKAARSVCSSLFVDDPSTLAALAITPRKTPKPLSTEARAAANAKAEATRKARGTTGKKQKALITGNVTGVTIIPNTVSPSTPAAASGTGTVIAGSPAAPVATPAPAVANGSTPHA